MSAEPTRILSIQDLNRYIKLKMDQDDILQNVWVRGEISNFTHHSRGHMYFTLKDAASRIRCVMFASQNQRLPFMPKDGSKVIAQGSISVYERDGQYQLYVARMQPDGIGSLYLAFEQLKKKLETEGLFREDIKQTLPRFPKTIGVITSPTGAAVRDIITTLQRRYPATGILLYPVLVQGREAPSSIARAIEIMNQRREADVLIIGRGGGSLEELWAFNEEIVARSIHASKIPVISAVGHETDFTISDFVADLRAATPTAAAELAVMHHLDLRRTLRQQSERMIYGLSRRISEQKDKLKRMGRSAVFQNPRRMLVQPAERLDRLTEQLLYRSKSRLGIAREKSLRLSQRLSGHNPQQKLELGSRQLESISRALIRSMRHMEKEKRQQMLNRVRHLDALSPLKIMQRGYSLVYDKSRSQLIKTTRQVQLGDSVQVQLSDGRLDCQVWAMEENE